MPQHSLNGRSIKEALFEGNGQRQFRLRSRYQSDRVIGLFKRTNVAYLQTASSCAQGSIDRIILKNDDTLEERHAARYVTPALNVHQRAVLEFTHFRLLRLNGFEPGQHRFVSRYLYAHRQGVDEKPDHSVGTRQIRGPSRYRRSKHNVFFATITMQEERPGSLNERVERYLMFLRKRLQSRSCVQRQSDFFFLVATPVCSLMAIQSFHHQGGRRLEPL